MFKICPQVYTLNPSSEIQLVHDIHGLVQNKLKVSGSQVLLHFSASPTAIMDEAFYMAWTALDTGISQSRCGHRTWVSCFCSVQVQTLVFEDHCVIVSSVWAGAWQYLQRLVFYTYIAMFVETESKRFFEIETMFTSQGFLTRGSVSSGFLAWFAALTISMFCMQQQFLV